MKYIVYMIEFHRKEFPRLYIGSKSKCRVENNQIIGERGVYMGSSNDPTYQKLVQTDEPYNLHILFSCDNYPEALVMERKIQIKYDVVANSEFFNKSIATENTFTNPDYATYKHIETGKIARLPRNHPKVLSEEWVGVTKGNTISEAQREKIKLWHSENDNPMLGKSMPESAKKILSKKASERYKQEKYRQISSKAGKKTKGKIWINDGTRNKRIDPNELHKFSTWVRGRLMNWEPHKHRGCYNED